MHAKSHSFTQQCILHAACATYYIPSCLSLNRDTILCVCVQGIAVAQEHHHQGCSETRWIRVLHANVYIVYLMRRNKYEYIFIKNVVHWLRKKSQLIGQCGKCARHSKCVGAVVKLSTYKYAKLSEWTCVIYIAFWMYIGCGKLYCPAIYKHFIDNMTEMGRILLEFF